MIRSNAKNFVAVCAVAVSAVLLPMDQAVSEQVLGNLQPDSSLESDAIGKTPSVSFFNDSDFLVVPIPVSDPSIGSGGVLAAAELFKTDEDSRSSMIGAAVFGTSNGSKGVGATAKINFDHDRYHAKGSVGYGNVVYDFSGIGPFTDDSRHVAVTERGYLFDIGLETRVAPNLYVGGQTRYIDIRSSFNSPDLAGEFLNNGSPISQVKNRVFTIGLTGTYDTRDQDYSPSEGMLIEGVLDFGLHHFLTESKFTHATLNYNRYDRLNPKLVLASHAFLCRVTGRAPIFDICRFGANNDLRGYPTGRYQDNAMLALQTELRWQAFRPVGFVAFAGVGSIADDFTKFERVLASAGAGIRILVSKDYGVNLGIDVAVTKDGETGLYVRVGEAF